MSPRCAFCAHAQCRQVSKSLHSTFKKNGRFSTLRKQLGFQYPWLVVFAYDKETDMIHVKVLNLATLSWHTVHVTPKLGLGHIDPKEEGITLEPFLDHMRARSDFHSVAVCNGKLFPTNCIDVLMGRIYEPRTEERGGMANQLMECLRVDSSVEIDGHLFYLATDAESGLRVYDAKSDSWDIVEGTTALSQDRDLPYCDRSFSCPL